jgi:carboxyl-terminal processing protease
MGCLTHEARTALLPCRGQSPLTKANAAKLAPMRNRSRAVGAAQDSIVRLGLIALLAAACAGRTAGPTAPEGPAPAPAGPPVTPPPLAETAPGAQPDARAVRRQLRREIFASAWSIIRDKHYDKTLGGLDWNLLRAQYEPLAVEAPDEPTFYRFLNQMLGELGQSHLEVSGPGADPSPAMQEILHDSHAGASLSTETGDPGLTVRIIEGRPTITAVRDGSSGARAGLRPGFLVTHVGGWAVKASRSSARPLRPVEERFYLRLAVARRLAGPVGTRVTLRYLDAQDRPGEVVLERDPPRSAPVKLGLLPPLYPDVHVSQVGEVGVLSFNLFLTEGVLPQVQSAIDGFRARGAKALVLDLRGNPGGQGAMAIPVAARLTEKPLTLGTLQFRDFSNTFTASPPLGVKPFLGRVVILTDEGTASTAEILAAGLQEAGRALVVGDVTLGAVLPSQIESLPGGAVIQYVVADFKTPKGVLLEGRGVVPDRRVIETRAGLLTGRDPVLDAALVAARASGGPK